MQVLNPNVAISSTLPNATGIYAITFTGALAAENLNQLTITNKALTIPAGLSAVVQTIEDGAGPTKNPSNSTVELINTYGATGGTYQLTFNGQTTSGTIAAGASGRYRTGRIGRTPRDRRGNVSVAPGTER